MRKTKKVWVGDVDIGGGAPIRVQSMTKSKTENIKACIDEILRLKEHGCEIVRVAVPRKETLKCLKEIKENVDIPVIADVHFIPDIAFGSLEIADGIRINPGNMDKKGIREVARVSKELGKCVRIGVNAGSLDENVRKRSRTIPEAMVKSAKETIEIFEDVGNTNIKVSLKSSDPMVTLEANRMFAKISPYPLHIGVTEAGTPVISAVRSSIALSQLLREGIGETIRISVTGPSHIEVDIAYEILRVLGLRERGVTIISCPTCGRCEIDLPGLLEKVQERLLGIEEPIKVAVMGCIVNGPGEAKEADVGIAGGKGVGIVFSKGKKIKKIKEDELVSALMMEVDKILRERKVATQHPSKKDPS